MQKSLLQGIVGAVCNRPSLWKQCASKRQPQPHLRAIAFALLLASALFAARPHSLYAQFGPEICDDGIDNDSDFLVDYQDPDCDTSDDDRDGIADLAEGNLVVDSDADGAPDARDADSDNDGAPDGTEGHDDNRDGEPDRVLAGRDSDGDGLDDAYDPDQGGASAPLPDHDGDGTPDWRDPDDDGDAVATAAEDVNQNGTPVNDDTDGDGIPDYLDADDDNDGLLTCSEDGNGDGNPANDDGNRDGIPDFRQPNDNVRGIVWRDQNGDGERALTDPFLPNFQVTLLDGPTLTPHLTTTTTITGWYQLVAPAGGEYLVEFKPAARLLPTLRDQGVNEATDSDILPVGTARIGRSARLTFGYGGLALNVDAGFLRPANLSVYAFNDLNRDGTRQVGEALVAGTTVILLDNNSSEVRRSAADNGGEMLFPDLLPGVYTLDITPPATYLVDRAQLLLAPLAPSDELLYEVPLYLNPKAVTFVGFTARYQEQRIAVSWTTAAELQTQGYHLYQSIDDIFSHARRVTTDLIPSQGSAGGDYQVMLPYNPAYQPPLVRFHFWLVEVETNGEQLHYGPIRVANPGSLLLLPIIQGGE